MDALSNKVLDTIRSHGMMEPGCRIVAGVSGGPDSVCLLRILHGLAAELQYEELCAVHVNHGLRGADSDGDEQFVRELAEELGIPFESVRCDVAGLAAAEGLGIESAARQARYEALEQCRQRRGAQRVAVAHNQNDQVETILMRILRGTGIHGLRGMEYVSRGGTLIRPLLDAERTEIETCCRDMGWSFRTDRSNLQTVYTRNRIRLELLPELEKEYNPKLREALLRLGRQAAETDAALDEAADRYIFGSVIEKGDSEVNPGPRPGSPDQGSTPRWSEEDRALSLDGFAALSPAVAKRVLQRCLERQAPGTDLSAVMLEQMYRTALGNEPAEADAGRGRYVLRTYGRLWFLRRPENNRPFEQPAVIPVQELEENGMQVLRAGGRDVVLNIIDADTFRNGGGFDPLAFRTKGAGAGGADGGADDIGSGSDGAGGADSVSAFLDWDAVKAAGIPVLRNRRPGDRIRPIGMTGSKKLQDYLVDRKIPRHKRDSLLLLAAGNRILLAGNETAADCAVTKDTGRILLVKY